MKEFNTYLNFNGNCRQAMEFYAKCLGADLQVMPFSQGPMEVTPETKDKVLHARLSKGTQVIMASDCPPGVSLTEGNNFSISINCESREEVDKLFASLGEKGKVVMPAQDMFWGAYFGMVTDQFGINWMFNFEIPKQS
ncbi:MULTISPECIES: VOC family protein [Acidobacteriaceae]|uniref:VOC family protein n=1 Tax=Acidobacteriaceae TaxID=204434 RepID=UPI00131D5351|nr:MULTISPECIES: VOC family protein [Acidobacteriaceae]MDW5266799.1 VOC family protein [Edaphobacter sp.]